MQPVRYSLPMHPGEQQMMAQPPATHVGDPHAVRGCWLLASSCPSFSHYSHWGMNQWMEDVFLSLLLLRLCQPTFRRNKNKSLNKRCCLGHPHSELECLDSSLSSACNSSSLRMHILGGSCSWVPYIPMTDLDLVSDSWHSPESALDIAGIWEIK